MLKRGAIKALAAIALCPVALAWDQFGMSLAVVGDVDGDGVSDIAVADATIPGDDADAFAAHVLSGRTMKLLFSIGRGSVGSRHPNGLAAVPDIDGDGYGELALFMSSLERDPPTRLVVFSMKKRLVLWEYELSGRALTPSVKYVGKTGEDWQILINGHTGFGERTRKSGRELVSFGTDERSRFLDEDEYHFGDVDNDGATDWMRVSGAKARRASLLRDSGDEICSVPLPRAPTFATCGEDYSGDGRKDVIVATVPSPEEVEPRLRVALHESRNGRLLFMFEGPICADFDQSVYPLKDVDGDGVSDLAIVYWHVGGCSGFVLYSGASGARIRTVEADPIRAPLSLGAVFGWSVESLRDPSGRKTTHLVVATSSWEAPTAVGSVEAFCVESGKRVSSATRESVLRQEGGR